MKQIEKSAVLSRAAALFCTLTFVSENVFAGLSTGQVTHVMANSSGAFMFVAGVNSTKPACSINGESWVFNGSTTEGKNMISVILSAQARGKPIQVIGTGNCTYWGDRENVAGVEVYE